MLLLPVNVCSPFPFLETIVTQADGSQLTLYASGDEFYHWVHDKDGYTIVQADDGYCYYAVKNDKGEMVPSSCRADKALPKEVSINPWLKIPKNDMKNGGSKCEIKL